MTEEKNVNGAAEAAASEGVKAENISAKKKRKKWPVTLGVVLVVLVAAGAGFWVWHEQPSFCNAICHTPMDPYNETYNQEDNTAGTDKWGNEVSNTHAMLAVSHKGPIENGGADATCMSCHVPQLSEQISEGINWLTGNYYADLDERSLSDLVEARGITTEEFCMNDACHTNDDGSVMTTEDLKALTAHYEYNPHDADHDTDFDCGSCHKAHRASVNQCTQCHETAEVPDGWLTTKEAKKLDKPE